MSIRVGNKVRTIKGTRHKNSTSDILVVTSTGRSWRHFEAVVCKKPNGTRRLYLVKNLVKVGSYERLFLMFRKQFKSSLK